MSNDANQIEFSFKKLMGFRMTDAQKAWYNENAGVLLNAHASEVWTDVIPATPPPTTTSVIEVYDTLTLTEDTSVVGKMAWLCKTGETQLTGFIPPRFGQGYFVRVFDNALNEILTADASTWTFDYDNGVLWFETSPLTYGHTMPIKIRVYRYVGTTLEDILGAPIALISGVYHERIVAEDDDCYIYVLDSNLALGPQLLVVGSQGGSLSIGMRWLNVDIPKDAVISTAYITFMSADNTPQTGTIIQAESAYIPATFTTYEDFIARVFGAESVPWVIPECGDGVSYDTPELKTIIQEIIDGVGWESGNPIALFVSDDGTSVYSQANIRDFGCTGESPLLHIEYTYPAPESPATIVVRFVANGPYRPTIAFDGAFVIDTAMTITSIYLSRRIPGTAGASMLDVNVNGISLYATQENRPTIQYSDGIVACTLPDTVNIAAGEVLTVDIDSRESGTPADLTLIISGKNLTLI